MTKVGSRSVPSKARMLARLAGRISTARILPLEIFTVGEWNEDAAGIEQRVYANAWAAGSIAVRSSAVGEDSVGASAAGRYTSVLSVLGREHFRRAVEMVRQSYRHPDADDNEILIQPTLE